jgi:hypothetical protein
MNSGEGGNSGGDEAPSHSTLGAPETVSLALDVGATIEATDGLDSNREKLILCTHGPARNMSYSCGISYQIVS